MMRATREDLRDFVDRGRVGGGLPLARLDAPREARRGDHVIISWRAPPAHAAHLRIAPPAGVAIIEPVPLIGRRRMLLNKAGRYLLDLTVTPMAARGGRRPARAGPVSAAINVAPPPPAVQLAVPARVEFGRPVRVTWRALEATYLELVVDGEHQVLPLEGELDLRLGCGRRRISVVALGDGGRIERSQVISVVAPPVTISAPRIASAPLGDLVRIRYVVTGARRVLLDELDPRRPAYEITHSGVIEIEPSLGDERLRIVAEGHDGRRIQHAVTVTAQLLPCIDIRPELQRLAGGV